MDHERGRQVAIIRFWRAVELFSPQAVPKALHRPAERVEPWRSVDAEPWVRAPKPLPHPSDPSKTKVWQHTVYLGVFSIAALYDVLDQRFEPDRESYDPRPPGDSALAAITVDQDGVLVEDSSILSGCGWATGRALHPGPGDPRWLDGFAEAVTLWQDRVDQLTHPADAFVEEEGGDAASSSDRRPLTTEVIWELAEMTRRFVGFPPEVDSSEIRCQSRLNGQQNADTPPGDFLNSFFLQDLDLVAKQARSGDLGSGLTSYLREHPVRPRTDVRTDLSAVLGQVGPDRMPVGRWPSNPGHPLALSQQLAANLALAGGSDGLLAVNGPPGTGKTTLLREIYAGLLVQRADVLAALASPSAAFDRGTVHVWNAGDYARRVVPLVAELTGFEMIVASSNNAAVANVSEEIPAEKEVDPRFASRVDYFAGIATALLQPQPEKRQPGRAAHGESGDLVGSASSVRSDGASTRRGWALTAARFGRKEYRSQFYSRFWFGASDLGIDYTAMLAQLRSWRKAPPPTSWADAVRDYRSARDTEQRALAGRARVAAALDRYRRLDGDLVRMRDQLLELVAARAAARTRAAGAADALREADGAASTAVERRHTHQEFRPGLLQTILTWGRAMRVWTAADAPLAAAMASTARDRERRNADRDVSRTALHATEEQHRQLEREISVAAVEQSRLRGQVGAATKAWGPAVPDESWWSDGVRRELTAPWLDQAMNDARSTMVLAALTLHRHFLHHSAQTMFANLQAACEVMAGVAPYDLDPAASLAAWQSLFLVVPLVSTTFASYDRMFGRLGREALGWLFVDEAGQASPAYAVGGLWRSRHTVVVGDPRQLKPVVTIPPRLEGAIAKHYGVSAKWRPHRTSVQQLADDVTPWGTTLASTDAAAEGLWVGAPLRVHRRCDQPMLDIANLIAYPVSASTDPRITGLMIDAVGTRDPIDAPVSQWYDVVSAVAEGHFIPAELDELKVRLFDVLHRGTPPSQVICISPFRDTAKRLEALRSEHLGLRAGTIHTAQGQEADVVFLVLSGHPAKRGAKQWASAEPNLLNVAVSRAKRRLYVIGDKTEWSMFRYFDVVAEQLDRHAGSA